MKARVKATPAKPNSSRSQAAIKPNPNTNRNKIGAKLLGNPLEILGSPRSLTPGYGSARWSPAGWARRGA